MAKAKKKDKHIEKTLSLKAKKVVDAKKASGGKPFEDWQSLLKEIFAFDATRDIQHARTKKWLTLWVIGFILLLFPAIFCTLIALDTRGIRTIDIVAVLVVLAFLACLYFLIAMIKKLRHLGKLDIMNDPGAIVGPLLTMLAEDVSPEAAMNLEIDLSGLTKEKMVREREVPPGRFKKVTEKIYKDPWCDLTVKLIDKCKINLKVENEFTEQKRVWRNPRGKYKSKTKWRKLVTVVATLFPMSGSRGWIKDKVRALAREEKVKIAKKEGGPGVRITKKYKFKGLSTEPDETVDASEIVGMLVQLYGLTAPVEKRR